MKATYNKATKTLTIEIQVNAETEADLPLSQSGKNRLLASSGGNQPVNVPGWGIVKVGLNAFIKA